MYAMACGQSNKRKQSGNDPITLWHLLYALKTNRFVIPSNTVYTLNAYKIICKLNQNEPDYDDANHPKLGLT